MQVKLIFIGIVSHVAGFETKAKDNSEIAYSSIV